MMLETSFMVDLLREHVSGANGHRTATGAATRFLEQHQAEKLRIPLFVLCELQLGVERAGDPERERKALQALTEYVEPVFPGAGFSVIYARAVSRLLSRGTPIPVMDALIGSIALQYSERIVTRDTEHFERIDGLVVVDYRRLR